MKTNLIVVLLLCAIYTLKAQDTVRTLIISEARIDNFHGAYVELTNVGTTAINLSQFEFGKIGPWNQPYKPNTGDWFMLPNKILAPGKSFVMAKVNDWVTKMWIKNPEAYNRYESKPEFLKLADLQIHVQESPKPLPQSVDSVSTYVGVVGVWNGSYCWYLRHHVSPTDSVVVDQVGGVFDEADGTSQEVMHDVAGLTDATGNAVLIRKASVKAGNVDFNMVRGRSAVESEWIVVPFLFGSWEPNRAVFWTVGNHGNYSLNSLQSSTLKFNFDTTTLTVPWGIRNDDSIMYQFNRAPGIAWHYDYAGTRTDSAYVSVRTGDKLTIYACGNKLEKKVLTILASDPKPSDNIVIPRKVPNRKGFFKDAVAFCEVTDKVQGMDTIRGIPFACRNDSLMKYLEKPYEATWKFVLLNGETRADLKKGDILAVTSENGATKQYYIQPNRYFPSHDARLSSITWPDIPASFRGKMGWKGDTIPDFLPTKYSYKVTVPCDITNMPGLVGKSAHINAKIIVTRATNLAGSVSDRTIIFTSTAEDDTTTKNYTVELVKDNCLAAQVWNPDPFISEYVFQQDYYNTFCEFVNPGTRDLDLSNYMITFGYYKDSNEAITRVSGINDFTSRYNKYIPGLKWVDSLTWLSKPAFVEITPDINIHPIVHPGNVFVMADVLSPINSPGYPTSAMPKIDIDFRHNPWNNIFDVWGQTLRQWWGQKIMLFKILNDSVKLGQKPAIDPKDFKLIDVMGDSAGIRWVIGGIPLDQGTSWRRKPEVYKGNPVIQSSFSTNKTNSEWQKMSITEYQYRGIPYPEYIKMVAEDIGSHFMFEATLFKSTVSSNVYKVSSGYSNKEIIKNIGNGTNVNMFYSNIIKADTDQHLKVIKATNGSILNGSGIISAGDTLIVVSADSVNTTKYVLDYTPVSHDARLTSTIYNITTNGDKGTISNIEYGTNLKTVLEGVVVPLNASIDVIDEQGAYVPMKMMNFDTVYQYVKVNSRIRFEVIAEDHTTKIVYQLQPNATDSDAFVTSNVYEVDQIASLIIHIPDGTTVDGFYSNIIPAPGATMKMLDKYGVERKFGMMYKDDKLEVTAANGTTKKTYYFTCLALRIQYIIYSRVYHVNAILRTISGNFNESTRVDTFLSNLIYYPTGTIKLYDSQRREKLPTDLLAIGDYVTGRISNYCEHQEVTFTLLFTTALSKANERAYINVYPNPGAGKVHLSGIESGCTIRVYNTLGKLIMERNAVGIIETISLEDQPKGVYLFKIVNSDNQETVRKMAIY